MNVRKMALQHINISITENKVGGNIKLAENKNNNINNNINNNVIIITTNLIQSIAENILKFLKELNYNVQIRYNITKEECINSTYNELYIFLNVNMINHDMFPKLFIVYQLEQSKSNWFNQKYLSYLDKCNNIWEISIKNTERYKQIKTDK